ncbi:hypothetical protein ES705_23408 [subsurface metagenome]
MQEDETFEMSWGELLQIVADRDERTVKAVNTFVGVVQGAVANYPEGDLHDFLASHTAVYAALVVSDGVIAISDPRQFFRACGFDSETIECMFIQFQLGVRIDQKLKLHEAGKVVE